MPLSCNFVKLVDVEEMSYFASNGEGEVGWTKVRKVGSGYLNAAAVGSHKLRPPSAGCQTLHLKLHFTCYDSKLEGHGEVILVPLLFCANEHR